MPPAWMRGPTGSRAGAFDVTVSRLNKTTKLLDFTMLEHVDLMPTDGVMRQTRIEFDTTGHGGTRVETRVFVEPNVDMQAVTGQQP
jgi:hypothetical protein